MTIDFKTKIIYHTYTFFYTVKQALKCAFVCYWYFAIDWRSYEVQEKHKYF